MDHTEQPQTQPQAPDTGGQAYQPYQPPGRVHVRTGMGGRPHGKVSSWALTGTVVVAFIAGGAALILHLWWLFWVCVGVAVLAVPAGKAIRVMDDTVVWGDPEQ